MDRRKFFAAASAALVATAGAAIAGRSESTLRAVHRYDRPNDRWVRCRMYDLRNDDNFWLEDVGVFRVVGEPYKGTGGVWEVQCDYKIDPATNQWVPLVA